MQGPLRSALSLPSSPRSRITTSSRHPPLPTPLCLHSHVLLPGMPFPHLFPWRLLAHLSGFILDIASSRKPSLNATWPGCPALGSLSLPSHLNRNTRHVLLKVTVLKSGSSTGCLKGSVQPSAQPTGTCQGLRKYPPGDCSVTELGLTKGSY